MITNSNPNDSLRQVRVTIVTKGEFQDLLERTLDLCNLFSSKMDIYNFSDCQFQIIDLFSFIYNLSLHCAVSQYSSNTFLS